MATNRIIELAQIIQTKTSELDGFYREQGIPTPSFDVDTPLEINYSADAAASQRAVLEATDELHALTLGPIQTANTLRDMRNPALHAIYRYGWAHSFPVGETATFARIAEKSGRDEVEVRRFLRWAMTYRVFTEPEPGVVAHTAASKALAQRPLFHQWVGMWLEELGPALASIWMADATAKWPGSQEPNETAYSLAHRVQTSAYENISEHPERAVRFKDAMEYFQTAPGFETTRVLESFDWDVIGHGTVVDVGGSHGVVCVDLARKYPSLQFVVQDREEVIAAVEVPSDVADRVKFEVHDFFTEQRVKNADVYFFRWILHNWSDKYCIQILKALIPALKPQARVLIQDLLLPEPGTMSPFLERKQRALDIGMLAMANAKERDRNDWIQLLKDTDPRFVFKNVRTPPRSNLSTVEVVWDVPAEADGR